MNMFFTGFLFIFHSIERRKLYNEWHSTRRTQNRTGCLQSRLIEVCRLPFLDGSLQSTMCIWSISSRWLSRLPIGSLCWTCIEVLTQCCELCGLSFVTDAHVLGQNWDCGVLPVWSSMSPTHLLVCPFKLNWRTWKSSSNVPLEGATTQFTGSYWANMFAGKGVCVYLLLATSNQLFAALQILMVPHQPAAFSVISARPFEYDFVTQRADVDTCYDF